MHLHSDRWKKVGSLNSQKSSVQNSRSKPRNNKFKPVRCGAPSELSQKISVVCSNIPQGNFRSKEEQIQKPQSHFHQKLGETGQRFSSVKSQQSFGLDVRKRIQTLHNSTDQLNSPTPFMKQLKRIKNQQISAPPVKALFSLDQEHLYIHQELAKVKQAFLKFKEIIQGELTKQRVYIKSLAKRVYQQVQFALQLCNDCVSRLSKVTENFDVKDCGFEADFQDFSIIEKKQSHCSSRPDLIKLFGVEYNQSGLKNHQELLIPSLDEERQNKRQQLKTLKSGKSDMRVLKTDRLPEINNQLSRPIQRPKSKKQFIKLFEAVNTLKKDMRELKVISKSTVLTQQSKSSKRFEVPILSFEGLNQKNNRIPKV